jgi:hypothetical protein
LAEFDGIGLSPIYNPISGGRISAKKYGTRTLVDVASIEAYYGALPDKDGPEPLFPDDPAPKAKAPPKAKSQDLALTMTMVDLE